VAPLAERAGDRLGPVRIPIQQRHARTGLGEATRECGADAGGGACNDYGAVPQR
jgi:hypothetical protein